jgi:hypothetical protein
VFTGVGAGLIAAGIAGAGAGIAWLLTDDGDDEPEISTSAGVASSGGGR